MKKILVLFAHPVFQTSLLNQSLLTALPDFENVTLHDLYEAYPNFMIDVEREQALLEKHDVIIFQHPLYWYSTPAILKEWMDLVLEHGFAYGTDATALKNKQFLNVVTSGGDVENYKQDRNIRNLLQPIELTAELCHMEFLPPFVVYGGLKLKAKNHSEQLPEDYLQQQVDTYKKLINDLTADRLAVNQVKDLQTINQYYQAESHD